MVCRSCLALGGSHRSLGAQGMSGRDGKLNGLTQNGSQGQHNRGFPMFPLRSWESLVQKDLLLLMALPWHITGK